MSDVRDGSIQWLERKLTDALADTAVRLRAAEDLLEQMRAERDDLRRRLDESMALSGRLERYWDAELNRLTVELSEALIAKQDFRAALEDINEHGCESCSVKACAALVRTGK